MQSRLLFHHSGVGWSPELHLGNKRGTAVSIETALEKLNLFHNMETFWKYCRKRLENPISIVLSNSIVWKC